MIIKEYKRLLVRNDYKSAGLVGGCIDIKHLSLLVNAFFVL